jgi:hypothetical protein
VRHVILLHRIPRLGNEMSHPTLLIQTHVTCQKGDAKLAEKSQLSSCCYYYIPQALSYFIYQRVNSADLTTYVKITGIMK